MQTNNWRDELRYARNAYRSAARAAEGFTSGQRVYNLKQEERRLRQLLWDHRDEIAEDLTCSAQPGL